MIAHHNPTRKRGTSRRIESAVLALANTSVWEEPIVTRRVSEGRRAGSCSVLALAYASGCDEPIVTRRVSEGRRGGSSSVLALANAF
jgi:hypothetical protein